MTRLPGLLSTVSQRYANEDVKSGKSDNKFHADCLQVSGAPGHSLIIASPTVPSAAWTLLSRN